MGVALVIQYVMNIWQEDKVDAKLAIVGDFLSIATRQSASVIMMSGQMHNNAFNNVLLLFH